MGWTVHLEAAGHPKSALERLATESSRAASHPCWSSGLELEYQKANVLKACLGSTPAGSLPSSECPVSGCALGAAHGTFENRCSGNGATMHSYNCAAPVDRTIFAKTSDRPAGAPTTSPPPPIDGGLPPPVRRHHLPPYLPADHIPVDPAPHASQPLWTSRKAPPGASTPALYLPRTVPLHSSGRSSRCTFREPRLGRIPAAISQDHPDGHHYPSAARQRR